VNNPAIVSAETEAEYQASLRAFPLAVHAERIRVNCKRIKADFIDTGERLAACKEHLGRAKFMLWVEQEFGWSEDTAERLIAVAAMKERFPQIAEMSIPVSALYMLAKPSTPEPARIAVATKQASAFRSQRSRKIITDFKEDKTAEKCPCPLCVGHGPEESRRKSKPGRRVSASSATMRSFGSAT
jgi:hypothetical protein